MKSKFSVWFARGYWNQELLHTCDSESEARQRADQEYDGGCRDITVEDQFGAVVYEPCDEPYLIDEF